VSQRTAPQAYGQAQRFRLAPPENTAEATQQERRKEGGQLLYLALREAGSFTGKQKSQEARLDADDDDVTPMMMTR